MAYVPRSSIAVEVAPYATSGALTRKILALIETNSAKECPLIRELKIVDASLITEPASIANYTKARCAGIRQIEKTNIWHFGMRQIDVGAESRLFPRAIETAASVTAMRHPSVLPHYNYMQLIDDVSYQGAEQRDGNGDSPGDMSILKTADRYRHKAPTKDRTCDLVDNLNQLNASIRAKVES